MGMELACGNRPSAHGEERGDAAVITITISRLLSSHPHWHLCLNGARYQRHGRQQALELVVGQCRSLAAAPLQGLPGCLSSLVTKPCSDPSLQAARLLWILLERKRILHWHHG